MPTEIVNINSLKAADVEDPRSVNIMRPTIYGNPFHVQPGFPRARALEAYAQYASHRINVDPVFRSAVLALKGKRLVCCCKPKECHGDTLLGLIELLDSGLIDVD